MRLGPIIIALRAANTHFGTNIGGAVELAQAIEGTLSGDMAFVIPLAEDAEDSELESSVEQNLTERFGVVVAIKNDTDEEDLTGVLAYDMLHNVRAQIVKEVVGWDFGGNGKTIMRGGHVVGFNTAYLFYQYEFEFKSILTLDSGGFGEIQENEYAGSSRKYPEEIDNFLKIYSQYVLEPSLHDEELKELLTKEGSHLPITIFAPDMEQMIDMSNQFKGSFDSVDFATAFDFFRQNK